MRRPTFLVCVAALTVVSIWPANGRAAMITVPNGDFETLPPDPNVDGDNNYNTGDISPPWNADNVNRNTNEAFTRPSSFVVGWQSNGPADTDDGLPVDDGKFGLQQPRSGTGTGQLYYQRSLPAGTFPTGTLSGAFNGNLIGFMNMDDIDGFDQEIQSVIVDNLQAGEYTLKVAVGARAGQSTWNDVRYDIMLVANPTNGAGGANNKFGSSGGTVLGTPASQIMVVLNAQPNTTNIADLTYTLVVADNDPNLGAPIAVRIATHNNFTQNGVADPGAPVNGGTNARFTQANFDNVRLEYVPEPSAVLLAVIAAWFAACFCGRRSH